MQSMTLEQLRVTANAGGIAGVTLKGQGSGFFVEIATNSGHDAVLSKARTTEPRRFGNPTSAMRVLHDLGIAIVQIDTTNWSPNDKDLSKSRQNRAEAMREAHEAVAYNQWLISEIQEAIDDPRQNISHEKMMAEMDTSLSDLMAKQ